MTHDTAIDTAAVRSAETVTNNLADILERVLDKGIVIAGDIRIQIADVDLLNIKIRLLVVSVDKAEKIGLDWWRTESFLSSRAAKELAGGKGRSKTAALRSGKKRTERTKRR